MSTAKTLNTNTVNVSDDLTTAYSAIAEIKAILKKPYSVSQGTSIIAFEDTMNGLVGVIKNQPDSTVAYIQNECYEVTLLADALGFSVNLNESLLPKVTSSTEPYTLQGKKLYPVTETVLVVPEKPKEETAVVEAEPVVDPIILPTSVVEPDFAQIDAKTAADAIAVESEPMADLDDVDIPLIREGLVSIINSAAANANGLQAGLAEVFKNPLADIINQTKDKIYYYTANSFANLISDLSNISSDNSLETEFNSLKQALGGGDGSSGAYSQLTSFKEHTDRLSGLVLDKESQFVEPTSDNTIENFVYNNLDQYTDTIIASFDPIRFRSGKYTIQATSGNEHQISDFSVIHDANLVYTREVNVNYTTDPFIEFNANISGGKVNIIATSNLENTSLVVYGVRLKIATEATSNTTISQPRILKYNKILSSYYNDGKDYIKLQANSLFNQNTVFELGREINDMPITLRSGIFNNLSTENKQSVIMVIVSAINNRTETLQNLINTDVSQHAEIGKKAEALGIGYDISSGYKDLNAKKLLDVTLQNTIKQSLE